MRKTVLERWILDYKQAIQDFREDIKVVEEKMQPLSSEVECKLLHAVIYYMYIYRCQNNYFM